MLAVRRVVSDVHFNNDVIVSTFETNIRVLGGLLGAHSAMKALSTRLHRLTHNLTPDAAAYLRSYRKQLLSMAVDLVCAFRWVLRSVDRAYICAPMHG